MMQQEKANKPSIKQIKHWIVDKYGDDMIKLLSDLAPEVFDYPAELKEFFLTQFEANKSLVYSIIDEDKTFEFKGLLYGKIGIPTREPVKAEGNKTPEQLMAEAGYTLHPECLTEADIQSFRHYYCRMGIGSTPEYTGGTPQKHVGEELCTFSGDRLDTCRVWFAVKNNVDEIRREDFFFPKREDEYGTSVISIQFTREKPSLSIKNRYNHSVSLSNPDCTFNNNLDMIIPGLTEAFARVYGVKDDVIPQTDIEIEELIRAENNYTEKGQKKSTKLFYKYNHCINDIFYCPNNVIIKDGKVIEDKHTMPLEQKRIIDYFVFDLANNTVTTYDPEIKDAFLDSLQPIKHIQTPRGQIVITKDVKDKNGEYEQVILEIDENNQIIGVKDTNLKECGDDYLYYNTEISCLYLPNLKKCGNGFLSLNQGIDELILENLEECGDDFLSFNYYLRTVLLDKLKKCGNSCLESSIFLDSLSMASLEESGDRFLYDNEYLVDADFPNWRKTGYGTFYNNTRLSMLNAPSLEECDDYCFNSNIDMRILDLPSLKKCGNGFFYSNHKLTHINAPCLEECGDDAFYLNQNMTVVSMPKLKTCGKRFFYSNRKIYCIEMPSLKECGDDFMYCNNGVIKLSLNNVRKCGDNFMAKNNKIVLLSMDSLEECGIRFLFANQVIEELSLPKLKYHKNSDYQLNKRMMDKIINNDTAGNNKKDITFQSLISDEDYEKVKQRFIKEMIDDILDSYDIDCSDDNNSDYS